MQHKASNFLTTWVIKFYSFQANKTFHTRMQKLFDIFYVLHLQNKICVRFSKMKLKILSIFKRCKLSIAFGEILLTSRDQNDYLEFSAWFSRQKGFWSQILIWFFSTPRDIEMYHLGFWLSEIKIYYARGREHWKWNVLKHLIETPVQWGQKSEKNAICGICTVCFKG